MKILVTAFEPFGGSEKNSSEEVLKLLPNEIGGATIVKQLIPVIFNGCAEPAIAAIEREKPDFVLCLGQRSSYDGICVERVAINCMDASKPDNSGYCPDNERVINIGENAYFSTLPIKQIASAISDAGILCKISNTAGTYVCNALMYNILHYAKINKNPFRAGFIHLPKLDKMPIETMVIALEIVIKISLFYIIENFFPMI